MCCRLTAASCEWGGPHAFAASRSCLGLRALVLFVMHALSPATQFDRFLTVDEAAHRTDRLPQVRNRNPPLPNDDGPFEKPRKNGGNLDRTFMPREDALRRDSYSTAPKPLRPIKVSHLNMSTLQVRRSASSACMRQLWQWHRRDGT